MEITDEQIHAIMSETVDCSFEQGLKFAKAVLVTNKALEERALAQAAEEDGEMSPFVIKAFTKQSGITDDVMEARLRRLLREQGKALLAHPGALVDGYQKLLRIIAYMYQIAGVHDCPEHILDVLADPESATAEQVEAMLPYHAEIG